MVVAEDSSDWSARLVGRQPNFRDVHDPIDDYPEALWVNLKSYIERSPEDSSAVRLPGGRYESARALVSQCPAFLAGRSLGEVCHIVQLALSQRKILGYSNGCMVPYLHSQSQAKEKCARLQRPCSGSGGDPAGMPVATWDVARSCLKEMLQSAPSHELPLPNVKRFFCSRFHVQLSETVLGYSKVSDLLQDRHFHDICEVKLRGSSYVVTAVGAERKNIISLSDHLFPFSNLYTPIAHGSESLLQCGLPPSYNMLLACHRAADSTPSYVPCCPEQPLETPYDEEAPATLMHPANPNVEGETIQDAGLALLPSAAGYAGLVKNTFIHAPTNVRVERRNLTVPKSMGLSRAEASDLDDDSSDSPDASTRATDQIEPNCCSGTSSYDSIAAIKGIHEELIEDDSAQHHNTLADLGHQHSGTEEQEKVREEHASELPRRVAFCPDEPLVFMDDDEVDAAVEVSSVCVARRVSFLSPKSDDDPTADVAVGNAAGNILQQGPVLTPGTLLKEGYCINRTDRKSVV